MGCGGGYLFNTCIVQMCKTTITTLTTLRSFILVSTCYCRYEMIATETMTFVNVYTNCFCKAKQYMTTIYVGIDEVNKKRKRKGTKELKYIE